MRLMSHRLLLRMALHTHTSCSGRFSSGSHTKTTLPFSDRTGSTRPLSLSHSLSRSLSLALYLLLALSRSRSFDFPV